MTTTQQIKYPCNTVRGVITDGDIKSLASNVRKMLVKLDSHVNNMPSSEARYRSFVAALDKLCVEHDVLLKVDGYDCLELWDGYRKSRCIFNMIKGC